MPRFFSCVKIIFIAAAIMSSSNSIAQVTLEQIMRDPDWIGNTPQNPYWADDGSGLFYTLKREGSRISDLYHVSLDGTSAKVDTEDLADAGAAGGDWSADRTRRVFTRAGDLFVRDLTTGTLRQLTRTAAAESAPFFLKDGFRVAFQRDGKMFIRDLALGLESQPFDVRAQDDPDKKKDEKYIEAQQERLFQIIQKREQRKKETREHTNKLRTEDSSRVPPTWYVGKKHSVTGRFLSPGGDQMVLRFAPKKPKKAKKDNMAQWVTDTGYVINKEVRALVGTTPAPDNAIILLDARTHEKHEIKLDALPMIEDDPLADLKEAAKARKKAQKEEAKKDETGKDSSADEHEENASEDDADDADDSESKESDDKADGAEQKKKSKARSVSIFNIDWNDAGTRFAFQARSLDNKDRWTCVYDTATHELVTVEHLRNVNGWINWRFNSLGWLPATDSLWFLSEATGYSHLYRWDASTQSTQQLTDGPFEVSSVTMFSESSRVLVLSNREHPGIREVYTIDTASGDMTRITRLRGMVGQQVAISPDEQSIAFLYSSITHPGEVYTQEIDPDADSAQITESRSEEFASMEWVVPQIVTIPSTHVDRPLYARLYLPQEDAPGVGPDGRRPVVCFVHGAGYLQNVHFGWSGYFREFMFHTMLTQHGYIVIDIDYRASAGYGAEWRTAIYRQMGTPELEDYLDGIDWLVANHNADPARVGIYGGSYGGFMAFMALFKAPESFSAGAALRPVTDWAHYNNGYTSNILNTPELDPEAYERSSPIELAEGLDDPLLICHGMVDDNVFFKDSVRLVQRLIELEKEDWELAVYPIEPHGFREPSSWLDEYRRVFKLFETNVKPTR
jgi:dipeptidyl aminopeptidase/acylaminoacyl peptidase